jgi:MFS family permease
MRHMPFAVWRLTLAYSLMLAGTSMIVLLAGIIGTSIAPSPDIATLPIALTVIGVACSTLPTGKLLNRFGRRSVFIANCLLAIAGALLASISLTYQSFTGFCAATFLIGWSAAASHQYRFAALEAVPAARAAKATSTLLLGGLLGAFIGPELAVKGRNLFATEFSGSFLLLAICYVLGMIVISFHADHKVSSDGDHGSGRPLKEIFRAPVIILAVASGGLAYGVMSLIMTATPISMHEHSGHSLETTKFVIQSHIAAMYLPSLFYGALCGVLGYRGLLWTGLLCFAISLVAALADIEVLNYWVALVLLGVGWNFLFLTGTNLLPQGYRTEERFRVQSTNDFLVFTVQAIVSLVSGWLLVHWQWEGLLWICVPLIVFFGLFLWQRNTSLASYEV